MLNKHKKSHDFEKTTIRRSPDFLSIEQDLNPQLSLYVFGQIHSLSIPAALTSYFGARVLHSWWSWWHNLMKLNVEQEILYTECIRRLFPN